MTRFFRIFIRVFFFAPICSYADSSGPISGAESASRFLSELEFTDQVNKYIDLKKMKDYQAYKAGRQALTSSKDFILKKQYEQTLKKAISARWQFSSISTIDPDSSLSQHAAKGAFISEILAADANYFLGNKSNAASLYFKALERVPKKYLHIWTPWRSIDRYFSICRKKRKIGCVRSVRRLKEVYPSRSLEGKFLEKTFSTAAYALPARSSKKTEKYSAVDSDIDAINNAVNLVISKNFGEARKAFDQIFEKYPKSQEIQRAWYWYGRLAELQGESQYAEATFKRVIVSSPFSYYAILSAWRIKKDPGLGIDAQLPELNTRDQNLDEVQIKKLEIAEEFMRQNLYSFARVELNQIPPTSEMKKGFLNYLAEINNRAKNYLMSFRYLSEVFAREDSGLISSRHLDLVFPKLEYEEIREMADQIGVSPVLAYSLIKQESAFQRKAISRAGALGFMQLMPFTAVDVEPKIYQTEILLPKNNLKIGLTYLKKVTKKFDGNIAVSLAGYNAGPSRSKKWYKRAQGENWGFEEFVEGIGYIETRGYVSSIARNVYWYERMINGKTMENFNSLYTEIVAP